jgi:hypothetical protein
MQRPFARERERLDHPPVLKTHAEVREAREDWSWVPATPFASSRLRVRDTREHQHLTREVAKKDRRSLR